MIHRYLVANILIDDRPINNNDLMDNDSGLVHLSAFDTLGDAMEYCSMIDKIDGQRSQLFVSIAE
jgi:hypothetical protein